MTADNIPLNLSDVRTGFVGRPFSQLVLFHLKRQNQEQRIAGLRGTIEVLPPEIKKSVEAFIDRWNSRAYDTQFWKNDTARTFDEILSDIKVFFSNEQDQLDDETQFNLFNIITLNFAYSAYDQPKMQDFIRGNPFPWISSAALLYPISAVAYGIMKTPMSFIELSGYGIANLGYLLLAASFFTKSFGIFRLHKRWQIIVSGAIALIVGTIFSNI